MGEGIAMKRIGLTQRVEAVPNYEERRDCLDQRWAGLLLDLGLCPIPLANEVQDVEKYLTELSLDGIIFTGGNDLVGTGSSSDITPERDRFEYLALDFCTTNLLPALGICRGLQLINIHHGGHLISVEDHVAHPHSTELDTTFFRGCSESIITNSFHGFAIDESSLSKGLKVIARAKDGTIEALIHERLPHMGVMWHPEREESLALHDLIIIQASFGNHEQ